MSLQPEAILYLASQRGCTEDAWSRSFHTLNSGNYRHEHGATAGRLVVFNDDTLGGGHTKTYTAEADWVVLLLPTVGGVGCRCYAENRLIEAGQSIAFTVQKGDTYDVYNPYTDDLVNFLHICMHPNGAYFTTGRIEESAFNLEAHPNDLLPVGISALLPDASACIGRFGGRQEGVYNLKEGTVNSFFFVIEGVFEIQDRLLETRDGLALRFHNPIEFEALSPNAVVFILSA